DQIDFFRLLSFIKENMVNKDNTTNKYNLFCSTIIPGDTVEISLSNKELDPNHKFYFDGKFLKMKDYYNNKHVYPENFLCFAKLNPAKYLRNNLIRLEDYINVDKNSGYIYYYTKQNKILLSFNIGSSNKYSMEKYDDRL